MTREVSGLSSQATRGLLAELAAAWDGHATVEATGGLEAARRVREGEPVDVVVLAAAVMSQLEAEAHLLAGSLVPVARSQMAVAVRQDDPAPDLSDAEAVRRSLLAAGRIGYSTGPSGDHLLRLLERWGLRSELHERLRRAPPGVPVGQLLAERTVDLAVQQRSELLGIPGITVLASLPPSVALDTVFTAGIVRTCRRADVARQFTAFLAAAANDAVKRRHGLEPA